MALVNSESMLGLKGESETWNEPQRGDSLTVTIGLWAAAGSASRSARATMAFFTSASGGRRGDPGARARERGRRRRRSRSRLLDPAVGLVDVPEVEERERREGAGGGGGRSAVAGGAVSGRGDGVGDAVDEAAADDVPGVPDHRDAGAARRGRAGDGVGDARGGRLVGGGGARGDAHGELRVAGAHAGDVRRGRDGQLEVEGSRGHLHVGGHQATRQVVGAEATCTSFAWVQLATPAPLAMALTKTPVMLLGRAGGELVPDEGGGNRGSAPGGWTPWRASTCRRWRWSPRWRR